MTKTAALPFMQQTSAFTCVDQIQMTKMIIKMAPTIALICVK